MEQFILALDQGTTSSRAILFNRAGDIHAVAQKEFEQMYPKPAWVEHNPKEIWSSQVAVAAEVISKAGLNGSYISGIGITNQRETTIVWNRDTGEPIYNAIVWQDRRTAAFCDELRQAGHAELIREKTGLILDAYFSATKVRWILKNVDGAQDLARQGKLAFGTVDTWLIWKLSNGKVHSTDITNASRTMLFNIHSLDWDDALLDLFEIPRSMLPRVSSCSEEIAHTGTTVFASKVPICGSAGDQQAAMFGQMCTEEGMVKNTYGTGCFLTLNIGHEPRLSKHNLLTTVAWKLGEDITYAFEGSIFIGGAVVQWLRDGLGIIQKSSDVEALAASVPDNDGVFLVPAFAGLGAPHWDAYARGTLQGLTRGSTKAHIARAALESIAYQSFDVLKAMEQDSGLPIKEIRVDGGASVNNLLMQFQADVMNAEVTRPKVMETTALGAAFFAGLSSGYWSSLEEIQTIWSEDKRYLPSMNDDRRQDLLRRWNKALNRSKDWETHE